MSAVAVITQDEIAIKSSDVSAQANQLEVCDQQSYENAAVFLKSVLCPMIDEVHSAYDGICKSAYDNWQTTLSTRKKYLDPLENAKTSVSAKIAIYDREQKRIQAEREREARAAAELAVAERIEAEIEYAEAAGADGDEIQAIIAQPVVRTKPVIPATIQRVAGIVTRTTYKCEVTDIKALARAVAEGRVPTNYLLPNQTALDSAARSQGAELARFVPGTRAVESSNVSARRG